MGTGAIVCAALALLFCVFMLYMFGDDDGEE